MQLPPLEVIAAWPAPNYIDPQTRGWANAIMNIVLFPLVCLALGIRVYTRLRISRSFGWDDWLILASFFPTTAFMIISLISEYKFNWNRHVWDVPFTHVIIGTKIILSTQVLFTVGSTLTKCSMLALLYRVVSKTSGIFPRVVISAIAVVAVQGTLFCFMVVFQCRPIASYWTFSLTPNGVCINQSLHLLIAGIINTTTDLLTTLLPIPIIYQLKLPIRQTLVAALLFAAGLLVTAAGAVRTYYTYRDTVSFDATWNTFPVWLSSSVELYVGIICASLPATKKFFTDLAPKLFNSSSPSKSNRSTLSNTRSTKTDLEFGVIEMLPPNHAASRRESRSIRVSVGNSLKWRESVETSLSSFSASGEEKSVSGFRKFGISRVETGGTMARIEDAFETQRREGMRVTRMESSDPLLGKGLPLLP